MAGPNYPIDGTIASSSGTDMTLVGGRTPGGLAVPLAASASGFTPIAPAGVSASASFTPAAAAYGAGDLMSVAQALAFTFADGSAIPTASLVRILTTTLKIDVTSVPSGQTSYTLHLYSVTPPSAQADNGAWTLASGDLASYMGSINLGTPVDLGAALYVKAQYVDFDLRLAGTSVYGVLVTAGAHTAAAVARQVRLHGVVL